MCFKKPMVNGGTDTIMTILGQKLKQHVDPKSNFLFFCSFYVKRIEN